MAAIREQVEQRYITVQRHRWLPWTIYNYSHKAQFDRFWTPETRSCRGLIVDDNWQVVKRPFPKFFNLGEHSNPLTAEPFEVYEKLDGSLGILYYDRETQKHHLATRGSFMGEQARKGSEILQAKYGGMPFRDDLTYLFEIIYPENRIVVDYGNVEDVVLLAVIETATGKELPIGDFADQGFGVVKRYDGIAEIDALVDMAEDNREGFVVRFLSGLRLKVKFEEYVRLHRLVTGVTEKRIWEYLKDGMLISKLVAGAPPAYRAWVEAHVNALTRRFSEIEMQCTMDYRTTGDRKTDALYFQTCAHPAVLFKMLDNRPYDEVIWKRLRPEASTPFKVEV